MDKFVVRLAAVILACAAGAAPAQVVVSQVYGGGGNSGATFKSDFIELRNNGAAAVSVDGWSVQYASATGSTWQRTNLGGSIAPGAYYLVKQADGTGGTTDLPTPNVIGTIAMSATAGKVALVNHASTLSGTCPLGTGVVDFVGFGSTANCSETTPTGNPGNTTAAIRNGGGSVDTNNNASDFSIAAPTPRNAATAPPPPPKALTIAQIQGAGLQSPFADDLVITEGIVTARKFNSGFFLQSANDDGDAATSEAIFVFTGSAPPATAAVGNRVRVSGKVVEFTPTTNRNQLSITEITGPTVELLESNLALPAAIELGDQELGPDALPSTLEKYEGMRVSIGQAIVVGASYGSINEANATSSSDGVFYVTLPTTARPFREPGIGALDVIPIPAGKNPPRFDTNPERLMVRSRGQVGAVALSADNMAQVDGLLGVLDYFDGSWALLPDSTSPPVVSGGMLPTAVNDAAYEDVTVGSFNLLRFFDEVADNNGAPTLTAVALDKRLRKTAAAICDYLKAPDILGAVEVENLRVLGLLADRINADCARAPGYVPYLVQGNDVGGINVGVLVSTRDNGVGVPRVEVVEVTQFGKDDRLQNPSGTTSVLNDRPPLLLRALVHQDNGASFPLTVVVNHLRSLNGIDGTGAGSSGWSTEGERVRGKRAAQAIYLAGLVESWQQARPDEKIVLVGDFNAFEFSDGYVDVLGIVRGDQVAQDQVLTWVASPLTTALVDGSRLINEPAQRYSYVYQGNAQSLDHVLVNQALLDSALAVRVDHSRINADFGVDNFGDDSVPVRVSDHDPVRVTITVPAFRSANLSVAASASTSAARAGERVRYRVDVANAGPNGAEFVGVAMVFDTLLSPAVSAAAGWSCAAPVQDTATTTVSCTATALARDATAGFDIEVIAPDSLAGGALRFAAAVASQTTDPANGNNQASATVGISADADLSVHADGPAKHLRSGTTGRFRVDVHNTGPDSGWQPRLVIRGDAPAANVAVAAAAGWTCTVEEAADGFEAKCASVSLASGASAGFDLSIVAPPRVGDAMLTLEAAISAFTSDPDAGNDSASFTVRLIGSPKPPK